MLRVDQTLLQQVIVSRQSDSYKGDYGRLLLIGGTYPYGGAIKIGSTLFPYTTLFRSHTGEPLS